MAKELTRRGKCLRWHTRHNNLTEQPANSNRDQRKDGITAAQRRLGSWLVGLAWCGVWCANGALAGGVKIARAYRWASVAMIEDDARAKTNGFRGLAPATVAGLKHVLRGDLGILFGRGVHVATVRQILRPRPWRPYWLILTAEGNTSGEGKTGSQSNGGQSARRRRPLSAFYAFPLVDYPNK